MDLGCVKTHFPNRPFSVEKLEIFKDIELPQDAHFLENSLEFSRVSQLETQSRTINAAQ
jgi:hypothetical protein